MLPITPRPRLHWYKPDVSQNTIYHTLYDYDARNLVMDAEIDDGSARDTFYAGNLEGQIFDSDMSLANSPHSRFYYFDGTQMGDVSNNGTSDIDYAAMITRHTTKPGTGFFTNGANSGTQYADPRLRWDKLRRQLSADQRR